MKGSNRNEDR